MKKTVLIVDDFESTLFVTGFSIQKEFNVIKATSAKEALNILENQKIDIIVTDYNMPEMNGDDFVREIKKNPELVKIPIFILSTETDPNVKELMYRLGVTAWIQKPFKLELLKAILLKVK